MAILKEVVQDPDENEEVNELTGRRKRRRRLKNASLTCRHCGDSFTSRISFQVHQRGHYEVAVKRGSIEGQKVRFSDEDDQEDLDGDEEEFALTKRKKRRKSKRKIPSKASLEARLNILRGKKGQERVDEDEDEIEFLTSDEEDRLALGTVKAVKALIEATKEERIKRGKYATYSPNLRDEIADYSLRNGTAAACKKYAGVTGSTVRNFVRAFKTTFAQGQIDQVGKFAFQFGEEKCKNQFHNKIDAELIRRMRKLYLFRNPNLDDSEIQSFYPSSDGSKVILDDSIKMDISRHAHRSGFIDAVNFYSLKFDSPLKESTISAFSAQFVPPPTVIVNAIPGGSVTIGHSAQIQFYQQPYQFYQQQTPQQQQQQQQQSTSSSSMATSVPVPQQPLSLTVERSDSTAKGQMSQGEQNVDLVVDEDRNKRGRYATYGPELRAQIGKFAVENGNQATIKHFERNYNLTLPESTVRRLRDKFLLVGSRAERLECGPRGRPMLLGKYDGLVRRCIRDLVDSGEKLTSFLAIATAKQVIQENEPEMLEENGGKLRLDVAWGKSFLSRMKNAQNK